MPINITTSNYINTQTQNTGSGQTVSSGAANATGEGAVVSVKGLDLQTGQTLSGQVVEIDGKDIKLLLSNNQTISAKLEGNINALLGQTLSFEVKNTEDGLTSLRPLYTNLNNSQNVTNALTSAGLPVTENYAKMVSSMMDENMPINKQAIYDMSKQINSFPNANPETVVKLTKLGLQVNELTINQFENYKGLESQIVGNVDTISKGLSDLIKDSLSQVVKDNGITDITPEKQMAETSADVTTGPARFGGKSLLTAFINAITGQETPAESITTSSEAAVDEALADGKNAENVEELNSETDTEIGSQSQIDDKVFDTTKMVLEMVSPSDSSDVSVSDEIKNFVTEFAKELDNITEDSGSGLIEETANNNTRSGRENLLSELTKEALKNGMDVPETNVRISESVLGKNITGENVLNFAKDILNELSKNPQSFPEEVKEKLTKLLASKEFGGLVKDNITKQMLLKPDEVVNSKNVEDLYAKITKQADQAIQIMQNAGKQNPEILQAANNIKDNVAFMNELNQVVTYVQLPLLMNNKSAHGDLYVYTNKKSLKNNDGNVSALLHLDMDNLGPMDIYVALTNRTKLNTHFYLQDEATIDFIEAHIDALNKRLTEKGYDMSMNVSVKDSAKGKTNISEEFFKEDPLEHGAVTATKMSFDVRA